MTAGLSLTVSGDHMEKTFDTKVADFAMSSLKVQPVQPWVRVSTPFSTFRGLSRKIFHPEL